MAEKTEVKKVKLNLSSAGKQRTGRCEIRCSENFDIVMNAIIDNAGKYSKPSKADVLHKALKFYADKEGLLSVGDDYYI